MQSESFVFREKTDLTCLSQIHLHKMRSHRRLPLLLTSLFSYIILINFFITQNVCIFCSLLSQFTCETLVDPFLMHFIYRYRKFDLGNGIVLVCRCELDAATYGPNGELQMMNIKSLNEWDSRVRLFVVSTFIHIVYWVAVNPFTASAQRVPKPRHFPWPFELTDELLISVMFGSSECGNGS